MIFRKSTNVYNYIVAYYCLHSSGSMPTIREKSSVLLYPSMCEMNRIDLQAILLALGDDDEANAKCNKFLLAEKIHNALGWEKDAAPKPKAKTPEDKAKLMANMAAIKALHDKQKPMAMKTQEDSSDGNSIDSSEEQSKPYDSKIRCNSRRQ